MTHQTSDALPVPLTRVELERLTILTRKEFALLIGIATSTVAQMDRDGRGPTWSRIGRRKVIRRSDIDAWLASNREVGSRKNKARKQAKA